MRASYRNPATGKRSGAVEERVTHVHPAEDGTDVVITICGRTTATYFGVPRASCMVDDELYEMPTHRTRTVRIAWSAFKETDDD